MISTLRRWHLYLGCFFAPLLIFFTTSGVWQMLGLQDHSKVLLELTSIHMGRYNGFKNGTPSLSSPVMKYFSIAMAISLTVSIILGIVLAYKLGHGKIATIALLAGVVVPVLIVVLSQVL